MINRLEVMKEVAGGGSFKRGGDSVDNDPDFEAVIAILSDLEDEGLIEIPPGRISRDSMRAAGGIRAIAPKITESGRAWLDEQT